MARTKDYEWIAGMYENEGIDEKKGLKWVTYLFENYFKSKRTRRFGELKKTGNLSGMIIETDAKIKAEKRKIRHDYLLLMQGSKVDPRRFVIAALSTSWIDEKIEMIINEMVSLCENGALYKTILEETYLKEKPLKYEALYTACGLCRKALLLFGVLTYKYANRREQEDIINGDISNEAEIVACIGQSAAII